MKDNILTNTVAELALSHIKSRYGLDDLRFNMDRMFHVTKPDLEVTDDYHMGGFLWSKDGEAKRQFFCPYMFWRKGDKGWRAAIPIEVKTLRYQGRDGLLGYSGHRTELDTEKMIDGACRLIEQSLGAPP